MAIFPYIRHHTVLRVYPIRCRGKNRENGPTPTTVTHCSDTVGAASSGFGKFLVKLEQLMPTPILTWIAKRRELQRVPRWFDGAEIFRINLAICQNFRITSDCWRWVNFKNRQTLDFSVFLNFNLFSKGVFALREVF